MKKTKLRHEEGVYVIEGKKMFLEFLDNEPEMIETVYATKEFIEKLDEDRLNALKTTTCLEVDGKVFSQVAETVTPQGVMAVVRSR